jgi:hypothetical protein
MFECKICDYKSDREDNLIRHNKSDKHIKKIEILNDTHLFICEYCKKTFKKKFNLNRHRENLCKNKTKSIELMQNVANKVDIIAENNNKLIENNNRIEKKIDNAVRSASSLIRYLLENHKNAPVLKQLSQDDVIKSLKLTHNIKDTDDEMKLDISSESESEESQDSSDNDDLEEDNRIYYMKFKAERRKIREQMKETLREKKLLSADPIKYNLHKKIIKNYKAGELFKYICETILRNIKTADIKEQSVFNTDYSRLNYAIKISKRMWNEDKAGVKFIKLVIMPTLECINNMMDEYRKHLSTKYELVKEKYLYDSDENKQLLDEIFETYQIQANTMSKNTIKQIAKDLAPELRFINIDKIDDDNINNIINNNI